MARAWLWTVLVLCGTALLVSTACRPGDPPAYERGRATHVVVVPSGATFDQAIAIVSGHRMVENDLGSVARDVMLPHMGLPHGDPEGMFLPGRYLFLEGHTASHIMRRAAMRMRAVLANEWSHGERDVLDSPREALILASIIESETRRTEDKPRIAGVFVRRLEAGWRLQADPTVEYGLGASFDGRLTRAQLDDDANPYNTYRRHGLPPTPICLPGRESIRAALNPAEGDEWYFLGRGDGTTEFSVDLAAHNAAARRYLRR